MAYDQQLADALAEIAAFEKLLSDKEYIRTKADYMRGHLSYSGQLAAHERKVLGRALEQKARPMGDWPPGENPDQERP